MVEKDSLEHLKLVFDLTGNYLFKAERKLYADAPQVVKDYITATYADYTAKKVMELITLADGTLEYTIFLEKSQVRMRIIVSSSGTLVCGK